jgi:hypothetical protein
MRRDEVDTFCTRLIKTFAQFQQQRDKKKRVQAELLAAAPRGDGATDAAAAP